MIAHALASQNNLDHYLGFTTMIIKLRLYKHKHCPVNCKVAWWRRRESPRRCLLLRRLMLLASRAGVDWKNWIIGIILKAEHGEPNYILNTLECCLIALSAATEGDNLNVLPMDRRTQYEWIITAPGVEKFWHLLRDHVTTVEDGKRVAVRSRSSTLRRARLTSRD